MVIYTGEELIKGAYVFVKRLLNDKTAFTFLLNNSSKSRDEAAEKLAKMGIKATEKHIYTSIMATAKSDGTLRGLQGIRQRIYLNNSCASV